MVLVSCILSVDIGTFSLQYNTRSKRTAPIVAAATNKMLMTLKARMGSHQPAVENILI